MRSSAWQTIEREERRWAELAKSGQAVIFSGIQILRPTDRSSRQSKALKIRILTGLVAEAGLVPYFHGSITIVWYEGREHVIR